MCNYTWTNVLSVLEYPVQWPKVTSAAVAQSLFLIAVVLEPAFRCSPQYECLLSFRLENASVGLCRTQQVLFGNVQTLMSGVIGTCQDRVGCMSGLSL
jgi:hypothetical protein